MLDEQEREETELQRLEAEGKQLLAQFKSENLVRKQAMQDKRRKLERLEEIKKLNAARVRIKVYDQVEENVESTDFLHEVEPIVIPQHLPVTSQAPVLKVRNLYHKPYQLQCVCHADRIALTWSTC